MSKTKKAMQWVGAIIMAVVAVGAIVNIFAPRGEIQRAEARRLPQCEMWVWPDQTIDNGGGWPNGSPGTMSMYWTLPNGTSNTFDRWAYHILNTGFKVPYGATLHTFVSGVTYCAATLQDNNYLTWQKSLDNTIQDSGDLTVSHSSGNPTSHVWTVTFTCTNGYTIWTDNGGHRCGNEGG